MERLMAMEIGCGNVLDFRFDERVDIKPTKATTKVCDMRDMHSILPDNTFSVIKISACIEHVDSEGQWETVGEMRRVLVNNGIVLVQTPDSEYWIERLQSENEEERKWAEIQMTGGMRDSYDYHAGLLSKDSLRRLFEMNGFETLWLRDGNEAGGSLDAAFQKVTE